MKTAYKLRIVLKNKGVEMKLQVTIVILLIAGLVSACVGNKNLTDEASNASQTSQVIIYMSAEQKIDQEIKIARINLKEFTINKRGQATSVPRLWGKETVAQLSEGFNVVSLEAGKMYGFETIRFTGAVGTAYLFCNSAKVPIFSAPDAGKIGYAYHYSFESLRYVNRADYKHRWYKNNLETVKKSLKELGKSSNLVDLKVSNEIISNDCEAFNKAVAIPSYVDRVYIKG